MKKFVTILVCAGAAAATWWTTPMAAADDPFALGLLQFSDLSYLGAFRLPDAIVNGDSFSYGGGPVAYDPQNNSLFVGSGGGRVAEVSIPTPSTSTDINQLPFASILQGFPDPTEGTLAEVSTARVTLDGMLVYGDRLYGAASIYYDANNTQRVSHFSRSTNLSASSFPAGVQWGGQVTPASCRVSWHWYIQHGRTRWEGLRSPVNAACRLRGARRRVPLRSPSTPRASGRAMWRPRRWSTIRLTIKRWGRGTTQGPMYGGSTQVSGVALVAGTRTALFIGRNGTGPFAMAMALAIQAWSEPWVQTTKYSATTRSTPRRDSTHTPTVPNLGL